MPLASFSSSTYTPDGLVLCDDVVSRKITLVSGAGALTRGTLLGKITMAATATGAAVAGGTGNGTITASPTVGSGAKLGVYRIVCVEPATNLGKFTVEDPDGITVGVATVGTEFTGGGLTFTIADGSTDFASGDAFTITIAAGSGKYKKSLLAATDGSQTPECILAEDADATSADAEALCYFVGKFDSAFMTFGTGHTAANTLDGLRLKGIHLSTSIAA